MSKEYEEGFGILNLVNRNVKNREVRIFLKEHSEGIIICSPQNVNDFYRAIVGLNIRIREYYDSLLKKYVLTFKKPEEKKRT